MGSKVFGSGKHSEDNFLRDHCQLAMQYSFNFPYKHIR